MTSPTQLPPPPPAIVALAECLAARLARKELAAGNRAEALRLLTPALRNAEKRIAVRTPTNEQEPA